MNGADLNSIETPAVLLDHDRLTSNIAWAQKRALTNKIALRPHIKTHKSLHIARLQLEAGAAGVTASKVDEALVFTKGGVKSVTVAYPQLNPKKLMRLCQSAKEQQAELRLTLDTFEGIDAAGAVADGLQYHVGAFIEIDVGLHRCGIEESDPRLLQFADSIRQHKYLNFLGLLSHAGHAYGAKDAEQIRAIAREECAILSRVRERLANAGFPVREVSVGATPTFLESSCYEGITEARPGNYVFLDLTCIRLGLVRNDRVSLSVLATIVSRNDTYYIVDSGSKVLSSDLGAHGTGAPGAYGMAFSEDDYAIGAQGLTVARLSEEHGFVKRDGTNLPIGSRVRIIPNHACPVANLAEEFVVLKSDGLATWPVDARAKVH